jgi:septum site-determining protein MinC
MAAEFIPAPAPSLPHLLDLPDPQRSSSALDEVRFGLQSGQPLPQGRIRLEAGEWLLRLPQLQELRRLLERSGLVLTAVSSRRRETLVAASALGLECTWPPEADAPPGSSDGAPPAGAQDPPLTIHRGTLRSGDHLQSRGSVLLLGDANPGSRISSDGHVMVWGRLRGVAHAGRQGDRGARIVALQLQPLQLRIADVVARGPEERPPAGLAEQARLQEGAIRIEAASPSWPLSG